MLAIFPAMVISASLLIHPTTHQTLAPGCQRAIISQNSGNGPNWHVVICDALKHIDDDYHWVLIVDGGPVENHMVVIGAKVPNASP